MISGKCLKSLHPDFHMLYGTAWKEDRTTQLVLKAFEAGFRGVDTVTSCFILEIKNYVISVLV